MYKPVDVDDYIMHHAHYEDMLHHIRGILQQTDLEETIKWYMPTYTIKNKNVISMCAFKNHAGLWFHHGALLSDPLKVLQNAQEGKTKAMRHWKFKDVREIDDAKLLDYIQEAIENEKAGRRVSFSKKPKPPVAMPRQLTLVFEANKKAAKAFQTLTPGRQRDYAEYIASAKRASTIEKRLNTIIPMIEAGQGLEELYRKKG